jgi:ribonuclease VapC
MSVRKVLDSYAILAFLENEPGADRVGEMIKHAAESEKPLLLSVINWGEVYYIVRRISGQEKAEEILRIIDTLPIEIITADREITLIAAEFKANGKMSYADCFAAALAKIKKAEIITGDREFKAVGNTVKILWI